MQRILVTILATLLALPAVSFNGSQAQGARRVAKATVKKPVAPTVLRVQVVHANGKVASHAHVQLNWRGRRRWRHLNRKATAGGGMAVSTHAGKYVVKARHAGARGSARITVARGSTTTLTLTLHKPVGHHAHQQHRLGLRKQSTSPSIPVAATQPAAKASGLGVVAPSKALPPRR